jgi:hypothetical protein
MWNNDSMWFEVAMISSFLLLGHIFFGHFEERSSKTRKMSKAIASVLLMILLSYFFGRTVAFIVFGMFLIPIVYIHGFWLPKKGINGWTGEPKSKYYDLRGWSKNIFNKD